VLCYAVLCCQADAPADAKEDVLCCAVQAGAPTYAKEELARLCTRLQLGQPVYSPVVRLGTDNAPCFHEAALVKVQGSVVSCQGQGITRKEAQRSAAYACYLMLRQQYGDGAQGVRKN
jgi:dsRNA-specific ribonuclease